jgi:hypothetical protein
MNGNLYQTAQYVSTSRIAEAAEHRRAAEARTGKRRTGR